jgi:hypothetical protein
VSSGSAKRWKFSAYPASQKEPSVAQGFNNVYCYAQGTNLCTKSSATEGFNVFAPTSVPSIQTAASALGVDANARIGINNFCDLVNTRIEQLGSAGLVAQSQLPPQFQSVCNRCNYISVQYRNLYNSYFWLQQRCPLTLPNAIWCGTFLSTGISGDPFFGAPYYQCRPTVLQFWDVSLNTAGIVLLIFGISALVLMGVLYSETLKPFINKYWLVANPNSDNNDDYTQHPPLSVDRHEPKFTNRQSYASRDTYVSIDDPGHDRESVVVHERTQQRVSFIEPATEPGTEPPTEPAAEPPTNAVPKPAAASNEGWLSNWPASGTASTTGKI